MESNSQEKKNLMQDNPIASHAGGSWMSKHSMAGGSPVHKGGSYKGSPAHQDSDVAAESIKVDDHPSASNAAGESQRDVISRVNSQVGKKAMSANSTIERNNKMMDSLSKDSKMKMSAYDKANLQRVKSTDSINAVNKVTFKQ